MGSREQADEFRIKLTVGNDLHKSSTFVSLSLSLSLYKCICRFTYEGPLADYGTPIQQALAEHQGLILGRTVVESLGQQVAFTLSRAAAETPQVNVG